MCALLNMTKIEIDLADFEVKFARALDLIKNAMENVLVETCPVDTSGLKISIHGEVVGHKIEFSMVDYAKHVEFGTKAHIIRPKNKKALHWGGKKGPVVKFVHHPGTEAQPFIRDAFYRKLPGIVEQKLIQVFK